MIDLEKLEQKIDGALSKKSEESGESLLKWIREERRKSQSLIGFIEKNRLNSVQNMKKPLDEYEAAKLLERFPRYMIEDVLMSMENYRGLVKKYKSCYLTALNWCKHRQKEQQSNSGSHTNIPVT